MSTIHNCQTAEKQIADLEAQLAALQGVLSVTGTPTQPLQGSINQCIEECATDGTEDKNKITLRIEDNTIESYHQYSVSWRDLCGCFAVSFRTETEVEARKLFEALQTIKSYQDS